jgi:hypothetical protein
MSQFLTKYYRTFFVICMGAIVGLSFYVGMLQGRQQEGTDVVLSCSDSVLGALRIPLEDLAVAAAPVPTTTISASPTTSTQGAFAGSKNGTKYYTPGCAGLNRIKPENLIWFQTKEDATLQGYTPAQC